MRKPIKQYTESVTFLATKQNRQHLDDVCNYHQCSQGALFRDCIEAAYDAMRADQSGFDCNTDGTISIRQQEEDQRHEYYATR